MKRIIIFVFYQKDQVKLTKPLKLFLAGKDGLKKEDIPQKQVDAQTFDHIMLTIKYEKCTECSKMCPTCHSYIGSAPTGNRG